MVAFVVYKCRLCGTKFKAKDEATPVEPVNDGSIPTPEQTCDAILGTVTLPLKVHQCSPRIAGVVDFAGVEFSEE